MKSKSMKSIIFVSVAATTVCVHLLLLPTISLAFTPSSLSSFHAHTAQIHRRHQRRRVKTRQYASPETNEASWNIGSPSRHIIEASKKKQLAKAALTKLLDRQQRDVEQTMELLHSLELDYDNFEKGQWIDGYNNSWDKDESNNNDANGKVVGDEGMFRGLFNMPTSSSTTPLPSITNGANTTSISTSITASVAAGVDYGYISRSEGCRFEIMKSAGEDARFLEYGPPGNIFQLSSQQFMRNLRAMIGEYTEEQDSTLTERQQYLQSQLQQLTLDTKKIWEREHARGPMVTPLIIKVPYYALCFFLDVVFEGKNPFGRFFMLETVARMPYFSYITMLHLYETLGFWRRSADIKRIHFAEEWNEFHHLLIMESLGGDQPYWVRFLAQHSAIAYYVALCLLWMVSPSLSYKFSEMLETHAVDTYGQFVDENEDLLKELPPSLVAVEYYTIGISDPMFGEYQTASVSDPNRKGVRKPGLNLHSLYDVFVAIRQDESDHVQTMTSCLDPKVATLSPALENRVLTGVALVTGASLLIGNAGLTSSLGGVGLNGIEGLEGLSDVADSMPDLDSILAEGGTFGFLNGIVGGLAGLSNGWQELVGTEAEIDDDVTGSALEDMAAGGELETMFEFVKSVVIGLLELIGVGL
ncbi:hypothetical protein ACHAWU_007611 [Discostella pseudostelligera]|uniref:Ubiquinol oxidase n=1 Tax=Discostella pseudostelligera TaxID=259834 RepID=A0ABD3M8B1_9STRA